MQSGEPQPCLILKFRLSLWSPPPDVFIWSTVTMRIRRWFTAWRREHIDIRIIRGVVRDTRSDFENTDFGVGAILQAMPIGIPGLEAGRITGTQNFLAAVRDERHLTRQHID